MVALERANVPTARLFGPPEVTLGNQVISLSTKAIGLIAYLALQQHLVTRDTLLELLWPDSLLESARKNLRNTLWTIRKALGDDAIVGDDDRVALGPSVWVDVRVFEQAVDHNPGAAIELYRGPLLDGVSFVDAGDLEVWIDGQRARLAQLHLRLLAAAADQLRSAQSWRGLIEVADRAIAHDDVHEPMYRALMEGYARLGERGEALRQYQVLRDSLDRKLGMTPLAETEALRDAIVDGTIQAVTASARAPRNHDLSNVTQSVPFVGRAAELTALDAAMRDAAQGKAVVSLVTGELGIGKSRLWQEWSATLTNPATVLEARCLDATHSIPFAPLVELLGSAPVRARIGSPKSPIAPVWLAEVARLAPYVLAGRADLPVAATLPTTEERGRVFEGLVQTFLALGGRPLVLFVDDIHWADRTTLEWLRYLVHRLRDSPFLLVAAYRPDEAPRPLVGLVASWGRDGVARRVALARLTAEEEGALGAAIVADDPGRIERARCRAGGNPFFLLEILRSGSDDVPTVLSDLIRARVERLTDASRQVVQSAAALEPVFDVETLRRTSGREELETLDAIDELLKSGVVVERQGQLTFSHPLIPMVIRDGLSGPRRAYVYRQAADALASSDPDHLGDVAGRLVRLYGEAGDRARAAHFADIAAERALAVAAVDAAVDFYREAIRLEPTPGRRAALARVLVRIGDFADARAAFEQALSEFEAAGDAAGAARASVGVAESYLVVGRRAEVGRWARRTLSLVERDTDPSTQALAHLLMGMTALASDSTGTDALTPLHEAARISTEFNLPDLAGRATFVLGNFYAERGNLELARQMFHRAAQHASAAGDRYQEVLAFNNAAYHALLASDLDNARQLINRALTLVEVYAFRLPRTYVYSTRGEIALAENNLDEASEWLTRALREAEYARIVEQKAGGLANLALVDRKRGDLDAAVIQLESARATVDGLAVLHLRIKIELWLAETYRDRGEMTAAHEALRRAETLLVDGDRRLLQDWAMRIRQSLVSTLAPERIRDVEPTRGV
jgi:DNA-binding SARP family transcriptional activator